ncbi:unnamed protein product [Trichogramma brassicae]|uniref:RRM domain-containing protein n=1 Tax=Trichogramma brassicae TaxID=86971 RepID=A0A6H5I773_9HYME|nr:unnamed protein product [Trichogramma brassicae]
MNNNRDSVVEKPDPDNIKMFVGQVPKDLDENDLRTIFEEFGRVHQINVLRDKYTGSSKGESRLSYTLNKKSVFILRALHKKAKYFRRHL